MSDSVGLFIFKGGLQMAKEFISIERIPTIEEYIKLRSAVGWKIAKREAIQKGLSNSLYSICINYNREVIGMGRVIGDGALAFYIQDIIVMPEFQKQGVGRLIMDNIMEYLKNNCTPNVISGLMAAKSAVGFYEKYGFSARPDEKHGPGMAIRW